MSHTSWVNGGEVDSCIGRFLHIGLLGHTLHLSSSAPLLRSQGVILISPVHPFLILDGQRMVGKNLSILDPENGHVVRVESAEVAGEGERRGLGSGGNSSERDLWEN